MKSKITYHEQTDMENTLKLREVLKLSLIHISEPTRPY